eukprot:6103143-Prymnesium_polylepis.1
MLACACGMWHVHVACCVWAWAWAWACCVCPRAPRRVTACSRAATAHAHERAPVDADARGERGVPMHGRRLPSRRDRRLALPRLPPDGGREGATPCDPL